MNREQGVIHQVAPRKQRVIVAPPYPESASTRPAEPEPGMRVARAVAGLIDASRCPGDYLHRCALLVETWQQGVAVSRADECPMLWAWAAVGMPVSDMAQGVDCWMCEEDVPHRHWGRLHG